MKKTIRGWQGVVLVLVVFASLGTWRNVLASSNLWVPVGDKDFVSTGGWGTVNIAFSPTTNEPYIEYKDWPEGEFIVKRFNGSEWVLVGNTSFNSSDSSESSFAFNPVNGEPYVAYPDGIAYEATVKKFNGSQWVTVGNANFTSSEALSVKLAFSLSTKKPYVAYRNYAGKITVQKYDGSLWAPAGNTNFNSSGANNVSLAFSPGTDQPYVAYSEWGGGGVTIKKLDGSQWITVGDTNFNSVGTTNVDLSFNPLTNQAYIAYGDWTKGEITVKKLEGSQWITVGNSNFNGGGGFGVHLMFNPGTNEPYVAYNNSNNSYKLSVKKFDGSQWSAVGNANFSPDQTYQSNIAFNPATNQPYVVGNDGGGITVMKYGESSTTSINGISIKKQPTKIVYVAGDSLDLSGLVVELDKSDGSLEDVAFENFSKYNITTYKKQGDVLSGEDKGIKIMYDGYPASFELYQPIEMDYWSSIDDTSINSNSDSSENLVVVTHGLNDRAESDWLRSMHDDILSNAISNTTVKIYDWQEKAKSPCGGDCFWGADNVEVFKPIYKNAANQGQYLANHITSYKTLPKNIHLIAHSVGSNLIQETVNDLANYRDTHPDWDPYIHLTFLDAFAPWNSYEPDRYGNLQGFRGYAEQYVDMPDLPYTNLLLKSATNFDVSYLTNSSNRDHGWPYKFYDYSVKDYSYPQSDVTPKLDGNGSNKFAIGFLLSEESNRHIDSTEAVSHKNQWCIVTNVADPYRRCFDHSVEEKRDVIITDQNTPVFTDVPNGVVDYTIDVSQFIGFKNGVAIGEIPSIKIGSELVCKDTPINMVVDIPHTNIESSVAGWNGIIHAPISFDWTKADINEIGGENYGENPISFSIGYMDGTLWFDDAVKITLLGEARSDINKTRVAYFNYYNHEVHGSEDISMCNLDQVTGDKIPEHGDCWTNEGNNLIIWTKHFTTFTVYEINDVISPLTILSIPAATGNDNWFASDVQVTLSATDNEGGSGVDKSEYSLDGGNNWITYSGQFTIFQEGINKVEYRSTDKAGNIEDIKTTEIKIDKTAPEIIINAPSDGEKYILNSKVNADWSVNDEASGIDNANGTVSSGDAIDTGSIGSKTFTVTATDKAGNSSTKSVTYKVVYSFGGFQDSLKNSKTFNANSTIPVNFQLTDANGSYITTAVASLEVDGKSAVASGKSNNENSFRYDSSSKQYIFNLSLKGMNLAAGTHTLNVKLDDGTTYSQDIVIK